MECLYIACMELIKSFENLITNIRYHYVLLCAMHTYCTYSVYLLDIILPIVYMIFKKGTLLLLF